MRLVKDLRAVGKGAEVDLILLGEVCYLMDRLEAIRASLAADGVTCEGSQGQRRPNPLIDVERALVGDLVAGFGRLGLSPDKRGFTEVRGGRLVKET
jgi:phage terminase small subunit